MTVAELIESLAPPSIAAIQRQRPDPLRMPPLRRVIRRHRQPMVFVKNHPQAVVEYVLRERDVHEESGTAARL